MYYLKIPPQYLKQDSMHQIPEMEFTKPKILTKMYSQTFGSWLFTVVDFSQILDLLQLRVGEEG
jgi:hypothetical protein